MREIERMLALLKRHTRFWHIGEVAFLCDCSERTIRRAIKAGKIKPIGDGHPRIPHSELVKFCDGRDPFLEFQLSILQLNINEEFFTRRISELQSAVDQLHRQATAQQ
ncbi:MAG: helix-turn-helix domain-containing protein [Blastocatellia bacterium]